MTDRRPATPVKELTAFLVLILISAVHAEDLQREVDALRPDDVTAQGAAVLENHERRAREALGAIPRSRSARDADRMRGPLRQKLMRSLGTDRLPWPPALRPRVTGILPRVGYRIEQVVYESLPGAPGRAHLYVPEQVRAGPRLAIYSTPATGGPTARPARSFPGVLYVHKNGSFGVVGDVLRHAIEVGVGEPGRQAPPRHIRTHHAVSAGEFRREAVEIAP